MSVIAGLIVVVLVGLVLVGWVVRLRSVGVMMAGITFSVLALMVCATKLHGKQRLWAIAPGVVFIALVVAIYWEWNRAMKG